MGTLRLNTIYPAFMGEVNTYGIGVSCTFVRLAGCNLRCYSKTKGILCDTPEALEMCKGREVSVSDILREVSLIGKKVVCLTGGEPLMQDVGELLMELSNNGYYVVVETNGSKDITPYRHIRNVSFVVDVKSMSSGESEKMLEQNYSLLDKNDFLKFVIDTEEECDNFYLWMVAHNYLECNIAVGTFWGSKITYAKLLDRVNNITFRTPIYFNMQTHKMMCLYDYYKEEVDFQKLYIPKEL